jgi:hypothetical protein
MSQICKLCRSEPRLHWNHAGQHAVQHVPYVTMRITHPKCVLAAIPNQHQLQANTVRAAACDVESVECSTVQAVLSWQPATVTVTAAASHGHLPGVLLFSTMPGVQDPSNQCLLQCIAHHPQQHQNTLCNTLLPAAYKSPLTLCHCQR